MTQVQPGSPSAVARLRNAAPLLLAVLLVGTPRRGDAAEPVRLTILQTSDVHGHLLPWDYARGAPDEAGLSRIATRVKAIRKEAPNVLLLDAGDTIQGTPIEYLHAKKLDSGPDPMAEAMSRLRYDAMSVGNHEFNFGMAVLRKAEKESSFPWLSANTRKASDGSAAFPEYIVKTLGGIKVGVLGMTTPNIPNWEPEANRAGLVWEDPVKTAARLVPVLREKERCDLVVVLIHSGPEVDL
ncbi:MAG TPA: metallophosphoesterase, partial [Thermoanaerobaculia bacterium]|nr:metallophosphoesterase [Thermoanaerobaculia bacterium]